MNPIGSCKDLREKWSKSQPTGQEMIEARIIAIKDMQKQCFKEELETLERKGKVWKMCHISTILG